MLNRGLKFTRGRREVALFQSQPVGESRRRFAQTYRAPMSRQY